MVDNFDTNVARRKPNIIKSRPVHPWDVPSSVVSDEKDTDAVSEKKNVKDTDLDFSDIHPVSVSETSFPSSTHDTPLKKNKRHKQINIPDKSTSENVTSSGEIQTIPSVQKAISKKHSDLSDTINIHSNFCKLDNDVSDHLFRVLSPSAQTVYLRLYRQSFGWNRNWAAESLPKLTKSCNISLQTVRKAIKELEQRGCIKKEFSDYHKATVYRIFLPSEIGVSNTAPQIIAIQKRNISSHTIQHSVSPESQEHILQIQNDGVQNSSSDTYFQSDSEILEGPGLQIRGQDSFIQSVYFSGTSVYALLESGGSLPKNISKYMTYIHLSRACDIIDKFYDSIGFSVVSRAQYRKSLIDYFDIIKSGFSPDDIMYAVRWTFKNSRSRPESFSLIKYTIHDAMHSLIDELKDVSGEKKRVSEKKEALQRNRELYENGSAHTVSNEDLKQWLTVVDDLRTNLNEHSFTVFIEPLKLEGVEGNHVILKAPQDSVSWVIDHFLSRIQETYKNHVKQDIVIEIK